MLSFVHSVKVLIVYGFFSGVLSAIIYLLRHGVSEGIGASAAVVFLAPFVQGAAFAAVAVMGYPFYVFLARRNFLGLGDK